MPPTRRAASPQTVRFCTSADGARIAYAVHGHGPPLLISTCWLSHLQFDWESPVWRHFLIDLGRFATVIRFDERGHGLSDWDVDDHSLHARLGDLEAVADDAGFERFALMAMAQGGPVAITYAARHPDRVARLLFYDSYADPMRDVTPDDAELDKTFEQLIKVGWGRPESTFRRVFSSQMIPGATEEQMRWLDELMRRSASASTALSARRQRRFADASDLLAGLTLPTLVLHSLRDRMNNFELGRHLASSIPGARLVALDSDNHILLEGEPAWAVFVEEVRRFVLADAVGLPTATSTPSATPSVTPSAPPTPPELTTAGLLTDREHEVLSLAAEGRDNDDIARALTVSTRTVERHLQNVYLKLDLRGRSARTAAVARLLTTG